MDNQQGLLPLARETRGVEALPGRSTLQVATGLQ
jgi:hypothetical protein